MPKDNEAVELTNATPMEWPDPGISALAEPANDDDEKPDTSPDEDEKSDEKSREVKDESKDKKPEWDKSRQKVDETAAKVSKVEQRLESISDTITSMPAQIRDMVAGMVSQLGVTTKTGGQEPPAGSADELMEQIEAMDPDDAGFDAVVQAVKALAKRMKSATTSESSTKAEIEKALSKIEAKDTARDMKEAARNARDMVTNHISDIERTFFSGKRTHRADLISGAQELCGRLGFDQKDNPPPASTGLMALTAVAHELYAKAQASQRVKDNLVTADNLSAGGVAGFGGKHLSMAEAIAEMKAEGKL